MPNALDEDVSRALARLSWERIKRAEQLFLPGLCLRAPELIAPSFLWALESPGICGGLSRCLAQPPD
jgi:hypothetical protein